jgi:fructokinase
LDQGIHFVKKAGGAPANVSVTISKLGGRAFYAGKVGNDAFGRFLKNTLDENGVNTSMLVEDMLLNTTLAFVSLKSNGERDFIFNRGADAFHHYDELNFEGIANCSIIHFGSATALLGGPSKETYMKLMQESKEAGKFVSFDPNYRTDLWKNNQDEFIKTVKECIKGSDFVKTSDDEIKLISGQKDLNKAVELIHESGAKVVAVTLGKEGTLISNAACAKIVPSIKIKSIDSTGAGDAFVGAFLYRIGQFESPRLILNDFEKLIEVTDFANKIGAIVCTKLGAISAIPTLDEVNRFTSQLV